MEDFFKFLWPSQKIWSLYLVWTLPDRALHHPPNQPPFDCDQVWTCSDFGLAVDLHDLRDLHRGHVTLAPCPKGWPRLQLSYALFVAALQRGWDPHCTYYNPPKHCWCLFWQHSGNLHFCKSRLKYQKFHIFTKSYLS